jgi:hypothetical protein
MTYINANTVPGHPLSGSGKSIPAGTNEGHTPNSGSDGWNYSNLPTSDPATSGSLWVSGSTTGTDKSKFLVVSQG